MQRQYSLGRGDGGQHEDERDDVQARLVEWEHLIGVSDVSHEGFGGLGLVVQLVRLITHYRRGVTGIITTFTRSIAWLDKSQP